jgi:sterol desaturase/sphingolipid hydroxylase (fatty acid hydroxylase superfamily)
MVVVICLVLGVLFTSLVEYAVHRMMHAGLVNGRRHAEHHRDGWAQGFWPELRDYVLPGSPFLLPPWLAGVEAGAGWTAGCVGYTAFMAYAHQLQHENPAACRWMRMPVHYVHHRDQMWEHNFGLAVDWWDHVFGTWRAVEFGDVLEVEHQPRAALDIHWRRTEGEGQPLARRVDGPTGAGRRAPRLAARE